MAPCPRASGRSRTRWSSSKTSSGPRGAMPLSTPRFGSSITTTICGVESSINWADPDLCKYVDGVAWHAYQGTVDAMTRVHNAFPNQRAYATEYEAVITSADFDADWSTWSLAFSDLLINWARCTVGWEPGARRERHSEQRPRPVGRHRYDSLRDTEDYSVRPILGLRTGEPESSPQPARCPIWTSWPWQIQTVPMYWSSQTARG
jgi:O-glycosyl hydrolase family 30